MRRKPAPKPKLSVEVIIPSNLREFLTDVDGMIKRHDEVVMIESDDLLQASRVYGGLSDKGRDLLGAMQLSLFSDDAIFSCKSDLLSNYPGYSLYGFTYFPTSAIDTKWEITLATDEIADIASGKTNSLFLYACQQNDCGNKFSSETDMCFDHDYE